MSELFNFRVSKRVFLGLVCSILFFNSVEARRVQNPTLLAKYAKVVGEEKTDELYELSRPLEGRRILEVNTTQFGGGVAEMLKALVPLFNELGIISERLIFNVGDDERISGLIKKVFNAFQGKDIEIKEEEWKALEEFRDRFVGSYIDKLKGSDILVLHDGAIVLAPAIRARLGDECPKIIWRMHYDSSKPSQTVKEFINRYGLADIADKIVYSMPDYIIPEIETPHVLIHPAIDPLSDKNKDLSEEEIRTIIKEYGVDPERPILLQVSRFDYFKDPLGVIEVYKLAKERIKGLQLVLIGGSASDDPEGKVILDQVRIASEGDKDIHVITNTSDIMVNAFQRGLGNTVVIQKSLKESFGLTVTEAMWKGTPVVASNVGGISYQITDNVTGFLHDPHDIQGFADRVVSLFENPRIRKEIGEGGSNFVREHFLLPNLVKSRLNLFLEVLGLNNSP
ncbi:MAG: glycosyltransferase [Candidatus Omnitrophota bacterium]